MEIDKDKIDDAILALLCLTLDRYGPLPVANHVAGAFTTCDDDVRHERDRQNWTFEKCCKS